MGKQALNGTRLNAFGMDPDDLVIIGLDTDDGPEHPLYDERVKLPLEETFVLNIMTHGVLENVSVRKNGDAAEVVYGRQRVKAAREANKRLKKQGSKPIKVPVTVRRGKDTQMFGVRISENEMRRGLSQMEKARELQRYLDHGGSEEEAAIDFGVTQTSIRNWLKLLDLDPKVQTAVSNDVISASAAAKLSTLSRDEQKASLAELTAGGQKATTKSAGAKAKNKRGQETSTAPGKRVIKRIADIQREYIEDGEEPPLSEDFYKALRWVLGDLAPNQVAGLTRLVAEAEGNGRG